MLNINCFERFLKETLRLHIFFLYFQYLIRPNVGILHALFLQKAITRKILNIKFISEIKNPLTYFFGSPRNLHYSLNNPPKSECLYFTIFRSHLFFIKKSQKVNRNAESMSPVRTRAFCCFWICSCLSRGTRCCMVSG